MPEESEAGFPRLRGHSIDNEAQMETVLRAYREAMGDPGPGTPAEKFRARLRVNERDGIVASLEAKEAALRGERTPYTDEEMAAIGVLFRRAFPEMCDG